ncbi:MAG: hypothetical protein ACI350_07010 [Prevotella sp.]
MKKTKSTALIVLLLGATMGMSAQQREKTTFQTAGEWKPVTDVRADLVMVYGANDRPGLTFNERVKSWRDRGYKAHFMTGIAWGEYQDYFTGKWDGVKHLDEGQKTAHGDTIWHGHMVPYIVPSMHYLDYFKQRHIKPVIDAGIDAIFLEEPEFWARAGYSEAFKREWQDYYGFPWRAQHESAENTYLSNKLKYHLYYRALDEAFSFAKQYGKEKGMDVRCYVPTHSLLNYSQWNIVSPEASLASMKNCDGYIAQVWTGTSREPNFFNGKERERVFETAFLEYGCMESMTRPTGRKMFFLTDPIEDWPRDWQDYKRNYEATFTAQLLYPQIADYEIMPWPDRIYEGLYRVSAGSKEKAHIPRFYSTQMQIMVNALGHMPLSDNRVSGSHGIAVAMANSLMFQRAPQNPEGYDDPRLSNFLGEALPLLERGVPVSILHLENTAYKDTWKGVKVLLLSYANMKPQSPDVHKDIAQWVKKGGKLIYSCRDTDPYQGVREWWNLDGNSYNAPSEHLFSLMGIPAQASEGTYRYGKGEVCIIRQDPKEFVLEKGGDRRFVEKVEQFYGKLEKKNSFHLQRGPYLLSAVLDEKVAGNEPLIWKGHYIDLYDHKLSELQEKTVMPGQQSLLYDVSKVPDKKHPCILASASRQYDEYNDNTFFSFTSKSPLNTTNAVCIYLPGDVESVTISTARGESRQLSIGKEWTVSRHGKFVILHLFFENHPDGVKVTIHKR